MIEKINMEAINEIVEKRNRENKILSYDDICTIVEDIVNQLGANEFYSKINILDEQNNDESYMGVYKSETKEINISIERIKQYIAKDYFDRPNLNNMILYVVLHECRHIYQHKLSLLDYKTFDELSLKLTYIATHVKEEVLKMLSEINIDNQKEIIACEKVAFFSKENYPFDPNERDANYFAANNVLTPYLNRLTKSYTRDGITILLSPTCEYLKEFYCHEIDKLIENTPGWEYFELFDMNPAEMDAIDYINFSQRIISEMPVEERFKYGLPIRRSEYNYFKTKNRLR